jgi:hypothetical protein
VEVSWADRPLYEERQERAVPVLMVAEEPVLLCGRRSIRTAETMVYGAVMLAAY